MSLGRLRNSVPPGVAFVSGVFAAKVLPFIGGGFVVLSVVNGALGIPLPRYITWSLFGAAVPFLVVARVCAGEFKKRRRASALGAKLAPVWRGRLPGNYDVLTHLMDMIENGYIGMSSKISICTREKCADVRVCIAEALWDKFAKFDNLFNLRIFWLDQLFTVEPEHIKVSIQPASLFICVQHERLQQLLATEFHNFEKGV